MWRRNTSASASSAEQQQRRQQQPTPSTWRAPLRMVMLPSSTAQPPPCSHTPPRQAEELVLVIWTLRVVILAASLSREKGDTVLMEEDIGAPGRESGQKRLVRERGLLLMWRWPRMSALNSSGIWRSRLPRLLRWRQALAPIDTPALAHPELLLRLRLQGGRHQVEMPAMLVQKGGREAEGQER